MPPVDIGEYLCCFWLSQLREYDWHLVGRGHGCYQTSYNAQGSPLQQKIICFKISIMLKLKDFTTDQELCLIVMSLKLFYVSFICKLTKLYTSVLEETKLKILQRLLMASTYYNAFYTTRLVFYPFIWFFYCNIFFVKICIFNYSTCYML